MKTVKDSSPQAGAQHSGEASKKGFFDGRRDLALLLVLCGIVMVLRWVKIESFYNSDTSMWLSQVGRFARGEMPYRDFSWNYPPLAIFLLGYIARIFGITFSVLQIAMDVISLAVVLLCWWLGRILLPPSIRFVTAAAVVAVCATTLTKFNLFSFATYSPSLHLAAVGLLMAMIGGVRQIRRHTSSGADFGLLAGGVFIASISKPEALAAAWGALILLAALDRSRSWKWYLGIAAAAGVASAAVYAATISVVGLEDLKAGIGGYGLASFACPWWPTGLGVYGAIACTGEAAFLAALLLWPVRGSIREGLQARMRAVWIAGAAGLIVFATYVGYQSADAFHSSIPFSLKIEAVARALIWTSPALLPVMWASIFVWIVLAPRWRKLSDRWRAFLFVLAIPVAISLRGLFGTTLFPFTEVSALCYPFFVMAAAWLIDALYAWALPQSGRAATVAVWLALGGYGILRFVGAWPTQLSDRNFYTLQTRAGTVRLADGHLSEQIYSYVVAHTKPGEMLFDLPYGGGFNFAAGLPSPAFTTQYQQLRTPMKYQLRDMAKFLDNPPELVIATRAPHFDARWGHNENMNCPFPRLVWRPDEPSWDPDYVFPIVRYIEQNYRVLTEAGPEEILGRRASESK
jgi:hypothetical protein